jgi:hypothetical protein
MSTTKKIEYSLLDSVVREPRYACSMVDPVVRDQVPIFFENKQVVIKGFQRTVAVTQIRPSTQQPADSQSPKDTWCHCRIAADCRSVITSDQTVGSSGPNSNCRGRLASAKVARSSRLYPIATSGRFNLRLNQKGLLSVLALLGLTISPRTSAACTSAAPMKWE